MLNVLSMGLHLQTTQYIQSWAVVHQVMQLFNFLGGEVCALYSEFGCAGFFFQVSPALNIYLTHFSLCSR